MRPLQKFTALACTIALLVCVSAGCGGSDDSSSGATDPAPNVAAPTSQTDALPTPTSPAGSVVTSPSPTIEVSVPPADAGAAPSTDPCDLLTAAIAEQTLGVPVGDPITQPGEGNITCAYRPAGPAAQGMVVLTLYGVEGSEAVLDGAAAQFPGAETVEGVGDAARVSVQSQVIGVLSGSTVFAIGFYPQQADGQLLPVTQDQLVAVARAVVDGQ